MTPPSDPLIGSTIAGKFSIEGLLAKGGMGAVYKGSQAPLGRPCAIKVMRPPEGGDAEEFARRFFLEASVASKLSHPNTVTIFDYGQTEGGTYYIAMELLEGRTLARAIKQDGPFTEERALSIVKQVARSLREAHAMGVIHRDIKPANIFLVKHGDDDDHVKVLDFGLVKETESGGEELTQAGLFMGSPKYMSPEQIQGFDVDGRTDVYALGVVLFEMLTGKVPFDGGKQVATLMAHVNDPIPRLADVLPGVSVSPATEAMVERCLAKKVEDRLPSMEDVLALLRSGGNALTGTVSGARASLAGSGPHVFVNGGPSGSPPPSSISAPEVRKSSRAWLVGGIAAVVAMAAGAAFFLGGSAPPPTASAGAKDPAPPGREVPPQAPASAEAPKPALPAPPATVRLSLASDPSGARVERGADTVCNATPCEVLLKGDDAKRGATVTFKLSKAGWATSELRVEIAGDAMQDAKGSLKRAAAQAAPPPAAPPTGWKDIPY